MNQTDRYFVSPVIKPDNFWKTIKLYLDKPQTVNKRLAGSVPLSYFKSSNEITTKTFIELRKHLRNKRECNGDTVINFLKENDVDDVLKCPCDFLENLFKETNDVLPEGNKIIILRRLLPKNKNLYGTANELVLIDFATKSANFIAVEDADGLSPFSYKITLTSDHSHTHNTISVEVIVDEFEKKVSTWIKLCLLPKLVKWCNQDLDQDGQRLVSNVQSLSLVDIEEYNDLYNELKTKYGLEMVKSVIPSNKTIFPNIDWIIGNHSDELSAWIPVIACRNSFQTKYFVLPCCPFEFNGTKYQRTNCQVSQYQDFLEYMIRISHVCGFDTKVDRLKIPSTKRCAIIGMERTWKEDEFTKRCDDVDKFIDERMKHIACDNWNFKPRDSVEKVQNCTKVDKNVQHDITKLIFEHLLLKKRYLDDFVNTQWNFGGIVALGDLVQIIPVVLLKNLKSECGGLQTLLRNNHQIFQVQQGNVQIRKPVSQKERILEQSNQKGKQFVFKQKECWFRSYHPDGCPFSDEDCSFKHSQCE